MNQRPLSAISDNQYSITLIVNRRQSDTSFLRKNQLNFQISANCYKNFKVLNMIYFWEKIGLSTQNGRITQPDNKGITRQVGLHTRYTSKKHQVKQFTRHRLE